MYELKSPLTPHPALAAAGISPAPRYPFTPPRSGRKSAKITAPALFRGGVHLFNFNISIKICTGSKSNKRIKYTLPPPLYFHSRKFLHLCGEVFRAICPSANPFREMVRKIAFEIVEVVRLGGYELYSPYKIRRRFRCSLRRIKHFAGLFTGINKFPIFSGVFATAHAILAIIMLNHNIIPLKTK